MRKVKIYFDESIPLINIIRMAAAIGCAIRGTKDGHLMVIPVEEIDYAGTPLPAPTDGTVVPFARSARCES
jgi:hypothetical protein